ncbi:AAA domain-containing protein [Chryseobacterium arthrosphaerae]|uniref:AAA domain-containing protein n=1 Tax=Chryseobacterium arthrosphaerae TaxID=651561 RepID=UPI0023E1C471|nr:AAA domain-containing protein [Chryseobacterium arthrosphaerae]WES98282.1 AAA domain-containing protein [Chryseobacterium arthrosphaerae]
MVENNKLNGITPKAIEIFLKINDVFFERFTNNKENTLSQKELEEILQVQRRTYFQKYPPSDRGSRHRILIPFSKSRAMELIVFLDRINVDAFTDKYFYRVQKGKEVSFFNAPTKETVFQNSVFKIINSSAKDGSQEKEFQQLYNLIEACSVPIADTNKEKDIKIWKNYVVALKQLVKEKEQIWKVTNVNKPYYVNKANTDERESHIEIFIDEKALLRGLEKSFKALFDKSEISEYSFEESRVFVEFSKYTVLDEDKINRMKRLAQEIFYDLKEDTPTHTLSGTFDFIYGDYEDKEQIFEELTTSFKENYHLDLEIENGGFVSINENDEKHFQKFILDNYSEILTLALQNKFPINVDFNNDDEIDYKETKIQEALVNGGLDRARFEILKSENVLQVTVNSFIRPDFFQDLGLNFDKSLSRYSTNKEIDINDFPGLKKVGREYHFEGANKQDHDSLIKIASTKYINLEFRRLPTTYLFNYPKEKNYTLLREFKTLVDIPNEVSFNLNTSILTITADDKYSFQNHVARIKEAADFASLESVNYQKRWKLDFFGDTEESREGLFNKLQNDIRQVILDGIDFQIFKKKSSLAFSRKFDSEEERDSIIDRLYSSGLKYNNILDLNIDSTLGTTTYDFVKNDSLELESKKELEKDVKFQTFIFLSPEERNQLDESIKNYGIDERFKGGIQIGKLVKKEKDKLTFKILDSFEQKLNAKVEERLELEEIKDGFVKPIFPGEMINIDRMLRAMRKVTTPGGRFGYPANQNLCNFLFDPNEVRVSDNELEVVKNRILNNLNEPLLKNQSKQVEAVAKTLLAKDMALIQGPPGTGKTTVIAEIIWQALSENPKAKILITSQTNLAVDNALERLKGKKIVRPLRIGKNEKFEEEGRVYSYDRILEWQSSKKDSQSENYSSDNAVNNWIDNVRNSCSLEPKFTKALEKWKSVLSEKDSAIKNVFAESYQKNINVFAATCSECGSNRFTDAYRAAFSGNAENLFDPEFDLVIMDEASKATPPELVLPLTFGKKVVIIGDHKQLPPMLDEKEFSEALENIGAKSLIEDWTSKDYATSQFEKLFRNAPKSIVTSLDTQFRMHEQIMNCISQFYEDQEELENGLLCGIKDDMDIPDFHNKASRWHGLNVDPLIAPNNHAIWINVDSEEKRVGTSFENPGEVDAISLVIKALTSSKDFPNYLSNCKREEDKEIGIITYYMPQMQAIKKSIYSDLDKHQLRNFEHFKSTNEFNLPFRINTVDRFQGMERNIVIISTVRSDKQIVTDQNKTKIIRNSSLGFAKELQRINVGFSRAKRLLIVIGNQKHFSQKKEYEHAISKMHKIDISQLRNIIE